MTTPPARPSVFHITHVKNLASIIAAGGLHSDATMIRAGGPNAAIGMSSIKARRLGLDVPCHPGSKVGEYVPFYFCPRSIMLYVIYRQNHPDLTYKDGQGPIVHLESDLHEVVTWASAQGRSWASARRTRVRTTRTSAPTWPTSTRSTGRLSPRQISATRP